MKEDGVRRRTGLHTSIHRRGPAPIGFSSPFLLPPVPEPSRSQANLSFQPSCFNVLTRVALPPPLIRSTTLYLLPGAPSTCPPHSRLRESGPRCSIHRVTKRTAQASADLPGSHFRLGGEPATPTRSASALTLLLLSISPIPKDF